MTQLNSEQNNNSMNTLLESMGKDLYSLFMNSPYVCTLWNSDIRIVGCNNAAVDFYKTSSPDEIYKKIISQLPEFQPDGVPSLTTLEHKFRECLKVGASTCEMAMGDFNDNTQSAFTLLKRIELGDGKYLVNCCQFISEMLNSSTSKLLKRDRLLTAVNTCSELLLTILEKDFNKTINKVLKVLGKASRSDRTYIWENYRVKDDNRVYSRQTHEWVDGVESVFGMEVIENVTISHDLFELLNSGNHLNAIVKELDAESRATLEPQGVKSILLVPIIIEGYFWGFIGFDNCHTEELWEDFEVKILESVGLLIANTSHRQKLFNELIESENRFQDISTSCNQIVYEVDLNHNYLYITDAYKQLTGIDPKDLIGTSAFDVIHPEEVGAIMNALDKRLNPQNPQEQYLSFEYRPKTLKKSTVWLRTVIAPYRNIQTQEIIGFRGFSIDITQEKENQIKILQMAEETKKLAEQAKSANAVKSQFLINMSHEIRTPLNAILGMSYLSLKNNSIDPKTKEFIKKIQLSANNLLTIVSDILDFSKIETQKMEITYCLFSLKEVLASLKDFIAPMATEKGLKFSILVEDEVPDLVVGDSLKINQSLSNLLNNAIKFTEVGSVKLEVTLEELVNNEANIKFSVIDTGIGIPEDQHEMIYHSFTQIDSSLTRKHSGNGLGLTITKRLVELMNGVMGMSSTVGKGSCFYFTLPMKTDSDDDYCLPAEKAEANDEKNYDDNETNQFDGISILLVEDNELNREVIVTILEDSGLNIDTATNGIEAVEAAIAKQYDIIFMDVQMPFMDGLEATKRIRQSPNMQDVPIIALTAHARESDYKKSIEAGMNDHISKPIKPEIFLNIIKKYVHK